MPKKLLIDASHAEETRVVVLDGNRLEDFDVETATRKQIKGNIYLAKVIRVEPSLQAAFVEYGGNRHGFLAFGEIHPDYYQIPVADRQRLLAQQAEEAEDEDAGEAAAGEAAAGEATVEEAAVDVSAGEAQAEAIASEAELLEVPLEYTDAMPADLEERQDAQPLRVTSIDILSAPAPDVDAPDMSWGASDAEYAPAEEETTALDGGEPAYETEPGDDGEYIPPQPEPENLGGDGDDAAEARERRQRQRFLRNYKIQEVIHRRQIMLIQVVKEERGNKGAALTTYLSLAGRFSVLMPNSPSGGGVSRKITSLADRRRLKEAMSELDVPPGMGLIVRTAGANRPKPEIKRDCEYLLRLWDDIRDRTMQSMAPALIYEEASLIKRTIRDVYTRDVDEVLVDGEDGFTAARDFMRMLMPSHAKKVQFWSEGQPLFAKYQVEAQLDAMLNPIVQLRSGGYIVINQTEALVSIDVNSGRSTRERNIEDTAVRTNLEAAEEVARQLRMRDLAGLIVIDFIDMESRKNNGMVERRLKDSLKNDRARIQVGSISHFGLMEMSRQRLRPSLAEASLITCPHCAGMGHVRSPDNAALHILRAIEDEGGKRRAGEIMVSVPPEIALYLFNHKREQLSGVEARYAMRVVFASDPSLNGANFRIEKIKGQTAPLPPVPVQARAPEPLPEPDEDEPETAEESDAQPNETAEDGNRRRRRRRRRGRRPDTATPDAEPDDNAEAEAETPAAIGTPPASDAASELDLVIEAELGAPAEPAPEEAKPRRRRTRGGRRRTRDGESEGEAESTGEAAPEPYSPPVYTDIADIFEAAERAEAEALRVKTHLIVAHEADAELALLAPSLPEAALEAVAHIVFEPTVHEPEPTPVQESEPVPSPDTAAATPVPAAPEPLVKPVLIDAEQAPVDKKRGWWRR